MLRSLGAHAAHSLYCAFIDSLPTKNLWQSRASKYAQHRPAIYEPLEKRQLLSVNVSTYHYNNAETGSNTSETTLTLNNVNTNTFGKIATMNVNGQIYGQPLVMTGIAMANGEGTHDIVLVATETDLVYAFDAYGNNPAQGYLWKTSLLQTGENWVPETDYGTTDIIPSIGVTGTPVINQATDVMYLVGAFKESNATYQQRIYAINISSGANAIAPVALAASVSGSTFNNSTYNNTGGVVTFSAFRENQRPALTLANGEVYVGFSSHGDQNPWHGWLLGYNATTLHQDYVYCNTLDGEQGGIWMSGGGIAVDSSGNLYFTTGNGTFNGSASTNVNATGLNYAMSLQELSPSLAVEQYFTPYNESTLSNGDLDFGCANVILLTGQGGSYPNEVLSAGKWGMIYLNNMASLGGFNTNGSGPNTDLGEATLAGANTGISNVHNTIVYWNGSVYLGGDALTLQAFSVANGVLGTTPSSQTSRDFGSASIEDGQGAGLTVSSNGSSNGIMWALDNTGFLTTPAVLYAYNASNLAQTPLWTSASAANNRDAAGVAIKFQDPVVANGCVYVAGDGSVVVYGLLSASSNTPTLVTPAAASQTTITTSSTTLTVLGSDPAGDLAPNYSWAATTIPAGVTAPTFSNSGTNNANVSSATFSGAGAYTLTATIEDPNSGLTITSSVTVTVVASLTSIGLTPASANVIDSATQQFTATGYDQYGNALATQPTFTWSVNTGGAGGSVTSAGLYTAPAAGTGFDTVTATTGSFTASSTVAVNLPAATNQVNLSSSDNRVGITSNGTTVSANGGIDGDGDSISANLVGTSLAWNSSNFNLPAPTAGNTTSNVMNGAGQTVTLSAYKYATLKILAFHVNGNEASATADELVVTYVGGTTQTLTQKYSDWYTPQAYTGEYTALAMAYRNIYSGANGAGPFNIYGYSFALNDTLAIQSIKMPTDANYIVVAMDLVGLTVTTAAAANPTTVSTTTTSLSATGTSPSGDAVPTYTWYTTSQPSGVTAPTFSPNGTTVSNVSTATFHAAGNYIFTVVITDPTSGLSATSSVSVTVSQTLTSISVTPTGTVSLYNGQTQQFVANAVDQFGLTMAAQPAFTWSVFPPGIGSVSSTGLFQAGASGTGSVTVRAVSGTVTGQSTVQILQPAWLGAGSVASWNSVTGILTVTGASSIIADPGSAEPIVQANGSAAVLTINPTGVLQIHLGGLSLTNGATTTVSSLGTARNTSNHRVLVLGMPNATSAPLLTIDSSSQLNLADNDMVDHDGNFTAVNGLLKTGYNAGAGYWNGIGIASSNAAVGKLTALGEAQPAVAGTFDNEPVGTSDVEIRYTYYGDANLDGHVDGSDYSLIDNGFLHSLTAWSNGDFNFDGAINGSDYTLMDNAFNSQGASLDAAVATPTAQIAAGIATTTAHPHVDALTAVGTIAPTIQEKKLISKSSETVMNLPISSNTRPGKSDNQPNTHVAVAASTPYFRWPKRSKATSGLSKPSFSDVKISV